MSADDLVNDDAIAEIMSLSDEEIKQRTSMLNNNIRIMKTDLLSLESHIKEQNIQIKENEEKVKLNKQLPYLVGNVVEVLQNDPDDEEDEEESGAAMDENDARLKKCKSCVIKTTTRQTVFLPIAGLVPIEELKPGDLIGTNKDSYLILEKLPTEYVYIFFEIG